MGSTHSLSNGSCSAQELVITLKPILQNIQPTQRLFFPSDGWERNMGFPALPFMRCTHTQTHSHHHARSSPSSGRDPQAASRVHGQPGSQLNGRLQRPSVINLCDQLSRRCKKQEPGKGHVSLPGFRIF